MPKRPNRQSAPEATQNKKENSKPGKSASEAWKETVSIVRSERFRFASGLALALLVVYCTVAFISYFFTGADDFSVLQSDLTRAELSQQIRNAGGILGARMQNLFVDRAFGIPVASVLVLMGIYAFGLMRPGSVNWWKVFFHCVFWLIWGSLALSFAQYLTGNTTFFRWGGAHGEFFSALLVSGIQWIGTLLLLLAVLATYFVGISRRTIPLMKQFAAWVQKLFTRKPKEEPAVPSENPLDEGETFVDLDGDGVNDVNENVNVNENENENIINLTDGLVEESSKQEKPADEPVFTIEDTTPEPSAEGPTSAEPNIGASPISTEPNIGGETAQDAPLTVDAPKDTEQVDANDPEAPLRTLGPYDPRKDLENYVFPDLNLLKVYDNENAPIINPEEQRANANRIVTILRNFGVEIESIKATVGPTVTLYEVVPKAGTRINKIQALENDIMMSLSATGIRIIAPMPGKGTVGIEVPNEKPQTVSMHSVIASKRFQEEKKMRLPIAMGRTITNEVFMFDLAKTPHLLVAGATGQGKSVAINAIITSLLYKKHPAEMKMVLVDPKMVEFAPYKPLLRHYLAAQPDVDPNQVVITDCDKVINTLNSLVIEMENRYTLLMDAGVRNLEDYNDKFIQRRLNPAKLVADKLHHQYLPYIVIVIDEYGDFIMQAGKQVETPIARITQKARAVGMHMILATQRPSVNIVTGVIKANIPTRIALRTQSVIDSRTVLDAKGAEQLIGRGDMLYAGNGNLTRIQCAFVDTPEVDKIVEHIEHQQHYFAPYELPEYVGEGGDNEPLAPGSVDLKKLDPMFAEVARYVVMNQQGSTSVLQRRFEIGYNRAGKLSDQLEAAGIVGPNKGPKGREVLIQDDMALKEVFDRLGI